MPSERRCPHRQKRSAASATNKLRKRWSVRALLRVRTRAIRERGLLPRNAFQPAVSRFPHLRVRNNRLSLKGLADDFAGFRERADMAQCDRLYHDVADGCAFIGGDYDRHLQRVGGEMV